MLAPQSPFAAEARLQLQMLVSALPAFEAVVRTDLAHSFTVYLELCRLAGQVSVLGRSMMPPVFPAYQHNDPNTSFDQVAQFILHSVDEGVPEKVRRFAFQHDHDEFRLPADPAWTHAFEPGSRSRLALAVRSEGGEQAITWGENCVIGGQSAVASLIVRRILGLARRYADHVGDVMSSRGMHLFELTVDAEIVQPGEDLLVLGSTPGVSPDALYLYLLDPMGDPKGV